MSTTPTPPTNQEIIWEGYLKYSCFLLCHIREDVACRRRQLRAMGFECQAESNVIAAVEDQLQKFWFQDECGIVCI